VLALSVALVIVAAAVLLTVTLSSRQAPKVSAPTEQEQICIMKNDKKVKLDLTAGEICMLTIPGSVDIHGVTFTSDNEKVIRVDSAGRADALSPGKAVVTAKGDDFSSKCTFTVTESEPEPELTELTTAYIENQDIVEKNQADNKKMLYSIIVNRRTNTVTVYTYDDKGVYNVPVRAMVGSCGKGGADITPTGDFSIYFKQSWLTLNGGVQGMYITGFEGSYLFHSVPYYVTKHNRLEVEEFNKLGTNASQGCVRLMVSDARWINKNCRVGTPVSVIDADASADPLGTPPTVRINTKYNWDPTDPKKDNPYNGKTPAISGVKDIVLKAGESFDPMNSVKAEDICGNDITDRLTLAGEVIADKPGDYYLTYSVTDDFKLKTTATRKITIKPAE